MSNNHFISYWGAGIIIFAISQYANVFTNLKENTGKQYITNVNAPYPPLADSAKKIYNGKALFAFTGFSLVAQPILNPDGGTYTTSQNVTITCSTSGATIHYTTNGAEPTANDPVIVSGSTVDISEGITLLKARAFKTGLTASGIKAAIYQVGEKVTGGYSHSLAIKSGNILWVWGNNNTGQLGDGTTVQKIIPIQVSSLSGIKDAAGGYEHTLALKGNGTVWSWGRNVEGQLGDGTTSQRTVPVQVSGLNNVINVAAGYYHSLAIKSDGSLWTWGKNNLGQLGNGTTANSPTPSKLNAITNIIDVSAGVEFSLALKNDGTVWAWGSNNWGQLGDSTTKTRSVPAPVTHSSDIIAIAAGRYHALALKADGTVWAWGHNLFGELGIGTTNYKTSPVQVINLSNVIAIAAGEYHSLALKSDGTFWAWGRNEQGQLGDLTFTYNRSIPIQVQQLSSVASFSAGTQTLSITPVSGSHLYWAFGNNNNGQLGDSTKINKNFRALVHFPLDENGNGLPEWQDYQYLDIAFSDNDRDGLLDWKEIMLYGTDAGNFDTNGDGLSDGANVLVGLSPTANDTDGDGISNGLEARNGMSSLLKDTDGDGVPDNKDPFPLDRFRTKKPPPNTSDHTPPVITLQEPF